MAVFWLRDEGTRRGALEGRFLFQIKRHGEYDFTTQCYVKGHPQYERDGIYRSIRDKTARDSVTVDFRPIRDSKSGDLAAKFDIVLGVTPSSG